MRASATSKADSSPKTITLSGEILLVAEALQAGFTPAQLAVEIHQENLEANKGQIPANRERIGTSERHFAGNDRVIKDISERFS